MPSAPAPLPEGFGTGAFDRAALERARRSQGRVRRKDVVSPYHGVHTAHAPQTLLDRCHVYAVRLKPGQVFSHSTAALLHGLPLPKRLQAEVPLHVAAVRPASPPRTKGVAPHRLMRPAVLQRIENLPVCAPSEAWVQLGEVLTLDEAIEIADHLLTVSPFDPDPTRRLLLRRIDATRRAWSPQLRAALDEARCPVLSPAETRVRLLLVRAGIPEPEVNPKIFDTAGDYLGKPDLVWRAQRLALEYEGAGHAEEEQMRIDIDRREAFHEAGWDIIRVSVRDLRTVRRRAELVDRVRRRLAARS